MGSYVNKNILVGETVIYEGKLHWIVFMSSILFLIFAILLYWFNPYFAVLLAVIAIFLSISAIITYVTNEYVITDKRVVIKTGFIKRNVYDMSLKKIEGVNIAQGIFGRILGYGTVIIRGTGGNNEVCNAIATPIAFQKVCNELVHDMESK